MGGSLEWDRITGGEKSQKSECRMKNENAEVEMAVTIFGVVS
jgi:hypothetical protein